MLGTIIIAENPPAVFDDTGVLFVDSPPAIDQSFFHIPFEIISVPVVIPALTLLISAAILS